MIRLTTVLLGSIVLMACAPLRAPAPEAGTHAVTVEGQSYWLTPLTAGTWTATASQPNAALLAQTSSRQAALVRAIEIASGCQVTDSNYAAGGRQLDAQVACAGMPAD